MLIDDHRKQMYISKH